MFSDELDTFMMRTLLLISALLGMACLGWKTQDILTSIDASFRMLALNTPVQTGHVRVDKRPDLFVPVMGPAEYEVPTEVVQKTRTLVTDGRRWHLYAPVSSAEPTATLLLFHGAGRNGLSMIDMWRAVADEQNLRLIALDGRAKNWPQDKVEPAILHRILDEAVKSVPSNPGPVFLFGHSNGGAYVQRLINEADGPWRAAAIHAGFADPAKGIIPSEPKPIRYYIGTREHIFKPDTARLIATEMARRGHNVDLQIVPQHTHWFYVAGPIIASDAWYWLSHH